jgi:hypothetical protein
LPLHQGAPLFVALHRGRRHAFACGATAWLALGYYGAAFQAAIFIDRR